MPEESPLSRLIGTNSPILNYAMRTSPAAEVLDQHEVLINGELDGDADGMGYGWSNLGGLSIGYKTTKEICIGIRTGSKTGSGSWDDPFHVADATALKNLINAQPVNTIFRLRDGTFKIPSHQVIFKAGQQFYGEGKGITILEWDGILRGTSPGLDGFPTYGYEVIFNAPAGCHGLRAEGFTIDCRGDLYARTPRVALTAVTANDVVLKDIRVTRVNNNVTLLEQPNSNREWFPFYADGLTRGLIENCEVDTIAGYSTALNLQGTSTKVIACRVRDTDSNAFGCGAVTDCQWIGITAERCLTGFNRDTWVASKNQIIASKFLACSQYAVVWVSDAGGASSSGNASDLLEVEDLVFEITGGRNDTVAMKLSGSHVTNTKIKNCVARIIAAPNSAQCGFQLSAGVGTVMEDSRCSTGLRNFIVADSAGGPTMRNNTQLDGTPMLDYGTGLPITRNAIANIANTQRGGIVSGEDYNVAIARSMSPDASTQFVFVFSGAGFAHILIRTAMAYPVVAGDTLEYDIFHDSANANKESAVEAVATDTTNLRDNPAVVDQNGVRALRASLNAYASGRWYHRVISLSTLVGKTLSTVGLYTESGAGTQTIYVRNVRVTNGTTVKKIGTDDSYPAEGTSDFDSAMTSLVVNNGYVTRIVAAEQRIPNHGTLPTYSAAYLNRVWNDGTDLWVGLGSWKKLTP